VTAIENGERLSKDGLLTKSKKRFIEGMTS